MRHQWTRRRVSGRDRGPPANKRVHGRDSGPSHVALVVSECASNWFRPGGACSGFFFLPTRGAFKKWGAFVHLFHAHAYDATVGIVLAQATEVG